MEIYHTQVLFISAMKRLKLIYHSSDEENVNYCNDLSTTWVIYIIQKKSGTMLL